jgi:hypothetical protein
MCTASRRGAQRPFVGHHMAAVTSGNKLYLIGGYLAGTTGRYGAWAAYVVHTLYPAYRYVKSQ